MAKSDFICSICKQVRGTSFISSSGKYKCPKHKFICGEHVSGFLGLKCKECNSKVISYKFNDKKGKWEQA
jgi:hypothetical protein